MRKTQNKTPKVFHSIEKHHKTYSPLNAEAELVSKMTRKEYLDWWFKTPEAHREEIIKRVNKITAHKWRNSKR
jgi:lysine/ornithine N-monooxygenase